MGIQMKTSTKIHSCEYCQANFNAKQKLILHVRKIHTGERPHKCDVFGCDRSFYVAIELATHKKYSHGIRESCPICLKLVKDVKRHAKRAHDN